MTTLMDPPCALTGSSDARLSAHLAIDFLVRDVEGDDGESRRAHLLLERGEVCRRARIAAGCDDGVAVGLGEDLLAELQADAAVRAGDDDERVGDRAARDVLFIGFIRSGGGHFEASPRR
jgi:hypothetical protein